MDYPSHVKVVNPSETVVTGVLPMTSLQGHILFALLFVSRDIEANV